MTSSDLANRLYTRFANSGNEFGDRGFKKEFQGSSSPNQARHYAGGFHAGNAGAIFGSSGLGNVAADAREYTVIPIPVPGLSIPMPMLLNTDPADTKLNAVSTRHAGLLADGKIKLFKIPDLIRKEVCQ
jgi:hypothetical protein